MVVKKNAIHELEKFKQKLKFGKQTKPTFYSGLSKPILQPKLTDLLNNSADDFKKTAQTNRTENNFQADIKTGINRFNIYYLDLDTEDRERICSYYEELMDCVGLESSGGVLNTWMYGFDPTRKK